MIDYKWIQGKGSDDCEVSVNGTPIGRILNISPNEWQFMTNAPVGFSGTLTEVKDQIEAALGRGNYNA